MCKFLVDLFFFTLGQICRSRIAGSQDRCQSVQSLSRVWLFVTPWTAAHQASLSITKSWSWLKLMSIELMMSSNHLILCHPLLLLPSTFLSMRVFPNETVVHIRWPKYWSVSLSISPFNEYSGLISFRMDWLDLPAIQGILTSLLQLHSSKASILRHSAFFTVQLSHPHMTTGKIIALTTWTFGGKVSEVKWSEVAQLCPTLCDPMDTRLLTSMEFSRQEYWSGLPFPSPGNFPTQGLNPGLPHCRQTLYHLSHQGSLAK